MEQNIGKKGNAKNTESARAKVAGKISKRPEQIWARPSLHRRSHMVSESA